jgi:hypothetical protein
MMDQENGHQLAACLLSLAEVLENLNIILVK